MYNILRCNIHLLKCCLGFCGRTIILVIHPGDGACFPTCYWCLNLKKREFFRAGLCAALSLLRVGKIQIVLEKGQVFRIVMNKRHSLFRVVKMKLGSKYDVLDTPAYCSSKNIFSASNFFMHIFKSLQHIFKVLKRSSESSKRSWFHKVCTINHYLLGAVIIKWLSKKPCKFVKKYFFCIKLLHAHLQYVCNISSKSWKDPMKALRGVYFTMYTLSTIAI